MDFGEVFESAGFPSIPLPTAEEGFTQSFKLDETESFNDFFNKYGFVIIDNVRVLVSWAYTFVTTSATLT